MSPDQLPHAGSGPQPLPPGPRLVEMPASHTAEARVWRVWRIVFSVIFIVFCLEIGVFLVFFPWTEYWTRNFFSNMFPALEPWWGSPYVRGAVSGVGVVNLYISLVEVFRLRRFAKP